jgi:hypothetical protein
MALLAHEAIIKQAPLQTAFKSEAVLMETVSKKENLRIFTELADFAASLEVEIGAGTVDLVLGSIRKTDKAEIRPSARRKLTGKELLILSCLYPRKGLLLETIAVKSTLCNSEVKRLLTGMLSEELIYQPTATTYAYNPILEEFDEVIAIEGKLSNWKKALEQANRNRLFASASYVVIDVRYSRPALLNLDKFKTLNIGLAVAISNSGHVEIVFRPRKQKPMSVMYFLLAKLCLALNDDTIH